MKNLVRLAKVQIFIDFITNLNSYLFRSPISRYSSFQFRLHRSFRICRGVNKRNMKQRSRAASMAPDESEK